MRAKINAVAASTWRVCFIAVALVAVVSCSSFAKKTITKVNVIKQADRTVICVQGNSPLSMVALKSPSGAYVGFQFPFALEARGRMVGVHSGGIANVRYGNFRARPPATRIVVNSFGTRDYDANWAMDRTRVDITIWKRGCKPAAPQVNAPVAKPASPPVERSVKVALPAPLAATAPAIQAAPPPAKDVAIPLVRLSAVSRSLYDKLVTLGATAKAAYQVAASEPPVTSKVMGMVETQIRPEPTRMVRAVPVPMTVSALPVVAKAPTTAPIPEPGKNISLNFLGADINDVLKALSIQSGRNIVAGKDVKGEVTVNLNNVSLDEAMDYIAKLSGYTYAKTNDTYLVASKESIQGMTGGAGPQAVTQVFALHYAKVDDVVRILGKIFPDLKTSTAQDAKAGSEPGKAAPDAGNGASGSGSQSKLLDFLVVSAPPDTMKNAATMINQMEESVKDSWAGLTTEIYMVKYGVPSMIRDCVSKLVPGVMIELVPSPGYAYPVWSEAGARDASMASKTAMSFGASGSSSAGSDSGENKDKLTRALTISGPAEQVTRALDLAERLDIKAPMINIEAKVTSINKSGEEQLGLKWNWSDISFFEGLTDYATSTNTGGAAGENNQNVVRSHSLWSRQPLNFGAVLDALVTNGNAKVLASPNLLCVEGVTGKFFVGDDVTYIQRIETTATGQNITTDTKSVGVQLKVTATVSPDGFVTLDLHPEVSTLKLTTTQGMTLPTVSRRSTDHVVRVKDGATIAIGGLIRSDEVLEMSKVPLLGDLPFLGKLFQHKSKTTSESEVVMFITAKVVKD